MKVIDMHAHCFPDKLAKKVLEDLSGSSGYKPSFDGTGAGLSAITRRAGYTYSVNLPVATRAGQAPSLNAYARSITGGNLLSFGALHPEDPLEETLLQVRSLGLPGVKIHPNYQGHHIDDPLYIEAVSRAAHMGIAVITHCGVDPSFPHDILCSPKACRTLLDAVPGAALIFAHTGGNMMWNECERWLLGTDCYIELSMSLGYMEDEAQFARIIKNHDPQRLLFGTDDPWYDPMEYLARFMAVPMSDSLREAILWKNAARLLSRSL